MGKVKCPRCEAENDAGYSFCMKCGAPLTGTNESREKGKQKFQLVLIKGEGMHTASYALGGTEHVCGREEGIILFPDDDTVSPAHAKFFYKDERLYVKDLDSTNGTYIRLTSPHRLQDGDMFICGEQILCYYGPYTVKPRPDDQGTFFQGTPISGWYFKIVQILKGGKPGAVCCSRRMRITIGREKCDLSFPEDRFLSHKHTVIEARDSSVWLEDAGSRNGTFVRLRPGEERVLTEGDYIFIGRQLLKVLV